MAFVILCLVCVSTTASSQNVISVTPANSASGVAVTLSSIVVKFDRNVDTNSLHLSLPVGDTTVDSSLGGVYVVHKAFHTVAGFDTLVLAKTSLSLSWQLTDDDELTITLATGQLTYKADYTIAVMGLRLYDPITGDTDIVNNYAAHFQTADVVHYVTSVSNTGGGLVLCGDTVRVTFNRKVDDITTAEGPIIGVYKYVSDSIVDSVNIVNQWQALVVNEFLSADSLSICFLADSVNDLGNYKIGINTGYLSGDSLSKDEATFIRLDHAGFKLSPRIQQSWISVPDGLRVGRGSRSHLVEIGDTISLSAPVVYDSLYFVKWECADDSFINNLTTPNFTKVITCSTLKSLEIFAVYSVMSKDTLQLVDTTGSTCGGYRVYGFADSLGSNTYTVYRGGSFSLDISARSTDTNCRFKIWRSTAYPPTNNVVSSSIRFNPGVDFRIPGSWTKIEGDFELDPPSGTCNPHSINVYADGFSCNNAPFTPQQPVNVMMSTIGLAVNSPYSAQDAMVSATPLINIPVTFTITNDCYEIQSIIVDGVEIAGSYDCDGTPVESPYTITLSAYFPKCERNISVRIRHKRFKLGIQMVSIDNSLLDVPTVDILRSPLGKELRDWDKLNDGAAWLTREVTYPCNTVVTLTPKVDTKAEGDHQKVGWQSGNPYTSTTIVDVPNHVLEITMDQDRLVRFRWKQDRFLITQIGLYVSDRDGENDFTPRNTGLKYFDVATSGDNKGNVIHADWFLSEQAKYITEFEGSEPTATVRIHAKFNKAVDEATLNMNFTSKDASRREDDPLNVAGSTYPYESEKVTCNLINNYELAQYLFAKDDSTRPFAMQLVTTSYPSAIKSLDPDLPLYNAGKFTFFTAPPRVDVNIDSYELLDDSGLEGLFMGDPEVEFLFTTGMQWRNDRSEDGRIIAGEPVTGQVYFDGLDEYDIRTVNSRVGFSPSSANASELFFYFNSWDEDEGLIVTSSILQWLANQISASGAIRQEFGDWQVDIGTIVAGVIAQAINAGNPPNEMNPITDTWPFRRYLWGARDKDTPTKLETQRAIENNRYKVRVTIKASRR